MRSDCLLVQVQHTSYVVVWYFEQVGLTALKLRKKSIHWQKLFISYA